MIRIAEHAGGGFYIVKESVDEDDLIYTRQHKWKSWRQMLYPTNKPMVFTNRQEAIDFIADNALGSYYERI